MGGIANGIAYHGGFIPYCATFLNFSDYMRGAVRLAALSGLHVIYVWTHDSVGLGEDGPTHQPVEHYAALRAIPNLDFMRPGDANETAAAWALAVERTRRAGRPGADPPEAAHAGRHGPSSPARASRAAATSCARRRAGSPQLILIGTGSELQLAFAAAETLEGEGIPTRVVSLPCWERFDRQDQAYRDAVLPPAVRKRVSVEVGVSLGWERWVGDEGAIIGLDHFGASAPAGHDLREVRLHRRPRRRGRPAGRPRRPPRPHPDARRRPLRAAPDDRDRRGRRRPDGGSDPGHS